LVIMAAMIDRWTFAGALPRMRLDPQFPEEALATFFLAC